ncbi:hypothetical protein M0802_015968 [Mischocyttarus mexicanus]|nr:hypothetical protein M0802_015968 [Mischocyttarus mexicanus]
MSRIRLDYVKTNPENMKIFLVQNFKRLRQGFTQRKVKVKSKQRNRQGGQGSKKLLVWFSQGLLKNITRINPQQLELFLVKTINSCDKVFLRKVKVKSKQSDRQEGQGSKKLLVLLSQGYLKDKTRLILNKSTTVVKSKQSDRQGGQGSKKLLVWFSQG